MAAWHPMARSGFGAVIFPVTVTQIPDVKNLLASDFRGITPQLLGLICLGRVSRQREEYRKMAFTSWKTGN